MKAAVFSDLDGTLIYSARRIDATPVVPVETINGKEASFMSLTAAERLPALAAIADFIPTTTRTPGEYARVDLPVAPPHAILSNGAVVVLNGEIDARWASAAEARSRESDHEAVKNVVQDVARESWVRAARDADSLFYIIVTARGESEPKGFDEWIAELAVKAGMAASRQNRKLYLMPNGITKESAAEYVSGRLDSTCTLAAGDAQLDRGLLEWADRSIRPAHALPGLPGRVTAASGPAAGADIVEWATRTASN